MRSHLYIYSVFSSTHNSTECKLEASEMLNNSVGMKPLCVRNRRQNGNMVLDGSKNLQGSAGIGCWNRFTLCQLAQNHEAPGLKSIPSLLQDCPLLPAVLATIKRRALKWIGSCIQAELIILAAFRGYHLWFTVPTCSKNLSVERTSKHQPAIRGFVSL